MTGSPQSPCLSSSLRRGLALPCRGGLLALGAATWVLCFLPESAHALSCDNPFSYQAPSEDQVVPTNTLLWGYPVAEDRASVELYGPTGAVPLRAERLSRLGGYFEVLIPDEQLAPNSAYTIEHHLFIGTQDEQVAEIHFRTAAGADFEPPPLPTLRSQQQGAALNTPLGTSRWIELQFEPEPDSVLLSAAEQTGMGATSVYDLLQQYIEPPSSADSSALLSFGPNALAAGCPAHAPAHTARSGNHRLPSPGRTQSIAARHLAAFATARRRTQLRLQHVGHPSPQPEREPVGVGGAVQLGCPASLWHQARAKLPPLNGYDRSERTLNCHTVATSAKPLRNSAVNARSPSALP